MSIRARFSISTAILLLCLSIPIAGCGGASDALAPVSGKVTYKGNVVNRGMIVFTPHPKQSGQGAIAAGTIQQDGTYRLKTGDKVGARPGLYRVTLAAYGDETTPVPGHKFTIPKSLLPNRYRDPDRSDLVREVKSQRDNVIHFQLD